MCIGAAHAERRVALVVGNSAYEHAATLKNPQNDAREMIRKLEELDFEVVGGLDLDLADMKQRIREFASKLEGSDLALFYYAGHGLQVNGENYILPTDAQLKTQVDLEFESVSINLILRTMEQATKTNVVFLDACRDNPLAEKLARSMGTRSASVGRGLAKTSSGVGTLISFSTQPGNIAFDGEGKNSPFTSALLKHLGTPGQDITRDLVLVRREVLESTNGLQVPWENSSLTGEIILKPIAPPKPVVVDKSESPNKNPQLEHTYWDSIKAGENAAYFENYLRRYPEGSFADIARLRIEEIRNKVASRKSAAEIAYWQSIENATQPEMFASYLSRYPKGIYAELADLKIRLLERQAEEAPRAKVAATSQKELESDTQASKNSGSEQTIASLGTPSETTVSEPDFQDYPSKFAIKGNAKLPDFNGRDRAYRTFRTRIRNGAEQGVNFAGHYSLVQVGCGGGCRIAFVVDLNTGQVADFPYGGEEYYQMHLHYTPTSRLLKARWKGDWDSEHCIRQNLIIDGLSWKVLNEQTAATQDGFCDYEFEGQE
jgi:Caspase domain